MSGIHTEHLDLNFCSSECDSHQFVFCRPPFTVFYSLLV